jgi:hypothetical protein
MISVCQSVVLVSLLNVVQPSEIDRLIQQLGSPKFAEREAASKRLEAIGVPAAEALRKAATTSPDIEIRRRAQKLLAGKDWLGPTPDDTNVAKRRRLAQEKDGRAVQRAGRAPGGLPQPAVPPPALLRAIPDNQLAARWRSAYADWQKDPRRAPEAIKTIEEVAQAMRDRLPNLPAAAAADDTQALLLATLEIVEGRRASGAPR